MKSSTTAFPAGEPAIVTENLRKSFTSAQKEPGVWGGIKGLWSRKTVVKDAVRGVELCVGAGETVGFLGPNGAGKTTTLKMLSGILHPTSGVARVLGYTPFDRKPDFLRQIALVMGQKQQLWWDLPARESLLLLKEIYGVSDADYDSRLGEMVELLDIEAILDTQVRKLSLGERMKCELVAALLHAPRVVFLDEPTIGLDVVSQVRIREFLRVYQARNHATILLTSHYMQDVKALCGRVVIIDRGEKMFDGAFAELVSRYSDDKQIRLTFDKSVDRADIEAFGTVAEMPDALHCVVRVPREVAAKRAGELLAHLPVADITIAEIEADEVIRQLFASRVDENGAGGYNVAP